MVFSAAVPKSPQVVEIANVAHAVPHGVAVHDFGQLIGLGTRHVLRGDLGRTDDQFTNFAHPKWLRFVDFFQRAVDHRNHAPCDVVKASADADAAASLGQFAGFVENLLRLQRGHRKCLGGAVRRVHFRLSVQQRQRPPHHSGGYGCAAAKGLAQRAHVTAPGLAVATQLVPDGRRCESLRYLPIIGCREQFPGIGGGRPREIHRRQNGRHAP